MRDLSLATGRRGDSNTFAGDSRCVVHKSAAVAHVASVASAVAATNRLVVHKCARARPLRTMGLSDGGAGGGDGDNNGLPVVSRRSQLFWPFRPWRCDGRQCATAITQYVRAPARGAAVVLGLLKLNKGGE